MNIKQVLKEIQESVDRDQSRQDILKELSQKYHKEDTIAKLIAMIPTKERRKKYKNINNVLFSLLILTVFWKVLLSLSFLFKISSHSLLLVPIVFLFPLLNIWFAVEVWKMRGYIYRILGLLALAAVLQSISSADNGHFLVNWFSLVDVILVVISILSFYIGSKLFPNYGPFGPKKDSLGQYIL